MTAAAPAVTRLPMVSASTRALIETQARLAAAWPLDEQHPCLDQCVHEVGIALMADRGYSVDPHEVLDLFVCLVDVLQRLTDLETDFDEYLGSMRLPRTQEQYDITRGFLLADKSHWTERLVGL